MIASRARVNGSRYFLSYPYSFFHIEDSETLQSRVLFGESGLLENEDLPSLAKVTVCTPLETDVLPSLLALPALILALLPFRVVHVDAVIVRCARVLIGEYLW